MKALLSRCVLLGADAAECTMPTEVVRRAQGTLVYQLNAYGTELRKRALDEHGAGTIDVRLRARSSTTVMFTDLDHPEPPSATARKL